MNMVHSAIAEILEISRYSKFKIGFVSAAVDTRIIDRWFGFSRSIRKAVLQYYIAMRIALEVWKIHKRYSYIIILESFPPYMFLSNIVLWPLRRKIMFVMHHSQQYASISFINFIALWYFKLFGFYSLQFEVADDVLPIRVRFDRRRTAIIPHPIVSRKPQLLPGEKKPYDAKIRLGIIGTFREGKPIMGLAKYVQGLIKDKLHNCELV